MAYKTIAGKCKVVIVHERTRGKEICSDLHHVRKALSSFRSIMEWKLISLSSSFNSVVALDAAWTRNIMKYPFPPILLTWILQVLISMFKFVSKRQVASIVDYFCHFVM